MSATNPHTTAQAVQELDAIADRLLDVHGQLALVAHPLGQTLADQTRRVLASAEPAAPSDARPVIVVPVLPSRANRGDT